MKILSLIFKEIFHRKINAGLSMLAVITAVGFFVCFFTTGEASKRETARIMRDMGYNIRIIHNDTDMSQFFATGYSDKMMPQDYANKFATVEGFLLLPHPCLTASANRMERHAGSLTGHLNRNCPARS